MIELPPGTHIWIAAGVTDMRRGFSGTQRTGAVAASTAASLRSCLSFFVAGAATPSRFFGMTAMVFAYLPSGLSAAASYGRRQKKALFR